MNVQSTYDLRRSSVSEFDEGWDACLQALKDQFGEDYSETNANEDFRVHKPETDGQMLARLGTDAQLWAREYVFKSKVPFSLVDEDFLMTWFANAIEAGRSAGYLSDYSQDYVMYAERERILEKVLELCDGTPEECYLLGEAVVDVITAD
jgi:hypothetical protein